MSNADRLLELIRDLDDLIAEFKLDGHEGYAVELTRASQELMWLYHDLVEYEL